MRSVVQIITPPVSTALTTQSSVWAELPAMDQDGLARLQGLIDQASSIIVDYIGRPLARARVAETFYPRFQCGPLQFRLSYLPIVSIVSATYRDAVQDALAMRYAAESGLIYGRSLYTTITYDAGYILPGQSGRTLPASIERACIDTVVALWHRAGRGDPMIRSESVEGIGSTSYLDPAAGSAAAMPPTAVAGLASYRTINV